MNRRTLIALLLLGGVFIMEGFDIAAMSLAVPRLEGALGLDPASFGWVFTALLVGLGVGGAFLAPYGDRFGRRTLIVAGCLATGLCTLGTASATDVTGFLIWRGLTGLALGAALPNVSALSAELAPPRLRATVMAVVSAGIPVGLALAGLFAPEIIAALGWQGMFIVPGVFAAILALLLFLALERGTVGPHHAEPVDSAEMAPRANAGNATGLLGKFPQLRLFQRPWVFPFAVFASMLAFNACNLYLLNSWLPTVLPLSGLSLDDAARVAGVANLAGLGIGLLASLLLDRWHKGLTLMLMFGTMAASFMAIWLTAPDAARWTLLLMVGVGGANAGGMVLPGLAAYLFPARLLSSAVGLGVLVARLGAFAGPPLGQVMLQNEVAPQDFLGVAAIPALACVIIALLVPAALRRSQWD